MNRDKNYKTIEFILKYFINKIYLLFLLPHTSRILQLLDLLIFSSLKNTYRKKLNQLDLLSDSTPIGKRNFLSCYYKTRIEGLTLQNITAGWKASGLWPKNITKPLISRLLLKNSNNEVLLSNSEVNYNPLIQLDIESSFVL